MCRCGGHHHTRTCTVALDCMLLPYRDAAARRGQRGGHWLQLGDGMMGWDGWDGMRWYEIGWVTTGVGPAELEQDRLVGCAGRNANPMHPMFF